MKRFKTIFASIVTVFSIFIHSIQAAEVLPSRDRFTVMNNTHVSMSGANIPTVFWGAYVHIDSITVDPVANLYDAQKRYNLQERANEIKIWAQDTFSREKITKISVDVPNGTDPIVTQLLEAAGFEKSAGIYRLSQEEVSSRLKDITKSGVPDNIYSISSVDSPFLSSAYYLYRQFNPMMYVPGIFDATVSNLLANGGKIYVHQNLQTSAVDGIFSYGFFKDKDGKNSILIDTLFVDPNARGQKIGLNLATFGLGQALLSQVEMFYWETGLDRTDARDLYSKLNVDPYGIGYRSILSLWNLVNHFSGDFIQYFRK